MRWRKGAVAQRFGRQGIEGRTKYGSLDMCGSLNFCEPVSTEERTVYQRQGICGRYERCCSDRVRAHAHSRRLGSTNVGL